MAGFTTAYTKLEHFLETPKGVPKYYIDHLPEDGIPFWDFNFPQRSKSYIHFSRHFFGRNHRLSTA
jgi:hypothetical protein